MAMVLSVFDLFGSAVARKFPQRLKRGIGVKMREGGQIHQFIAPFAGSGSTLDRVLVADKQGELEAGAVFHYSPFQASELRGVLQRLDSTIADNATVGFGLDRATSLCWPIPGKAINFGVCYRGKSLEEHFFAANDGGVSQQTLTLLWQEVRALTAKDLKRTGASWDHLRVVKSEYSWRSAMRELAQETMVEGPFAALLGPGQLETLTREFWQVVAEEPKNEGMEQPSNEITTEPKDGKTEKLNSQWVGDDCPVELRQYLAKIYEREKLDRGVEPSPKVVFDDEKVSGFAVKLPARMPVITSKVFLDPSIIEHGYDYLALIKMLNGFFGSHWGSFEKVSGEKAWSPRVGEVNLTTISQCSVEIYVEEAGPEGHKIPRVHFCFVVPAKTKTTITYEPLSVGVVAADFNAWHEFFQETELGTVMPRIDVEANIVQAGRWDWAKERSARTKLAQFKFTTETTVVIPEKEVYYLLKPDFVQAALLTV